MPPGSQVSGPGCYHPVPGSEGHGGVRDNSPAPQLSSPLRSHLLASSCPVRTPGLATSLLRKRAQRDKSAAWGSAPRGKAAPVPHTSLTNSSIREPRGHFPPPNPPLAAAIWLSSRRPCLHQLFAPSLPLAKRSKEKGAKICALVPLNFPTGKWPKLSRQEQRLPKGGEFPKLIQRPHERAQPPRTGPSKQLRTQPRPSLPSHRLRRTTSSTFSKGVCF